MAVHNDHSITIAGTVGGIVASLFVNIRTEDFVETMVLSGIGAVVSFLVSLGLRWITSKASGRGKGSP